MEKNCLTFSNLTGKRKTQREQTESQSERVHHIWLAPAQVFHDIEWTVVLWVNIHPLIWRLMVQILALAMPIFFWTRQLKNEMEKWTWRRALPQWRKADLFSQPHYISLVRRKRIGFVNEMETVMARTKKEL